MLLDHIRHVVPTIRRDYPEWHHGRERYALWYIEIQNPDLISYLNQVQDYFSEYLLLPNTRQFHITLFICGFLTTDQAKDQANFDDDFTQAQFQQQFQRLKSQLSQKIKLKIGGLNSFSSALYLKVIDTDSALAHIRAQCAQFSDEVAALSYCPHITVGLYNAAFPSQSILDKMVAFPARQFEIEISQIKFGYYKAQELQGPLHAIQSISLGDVCCNSY
ncbi:2'-5' RNA ligase family protein [Acinetobacter zhairhuonensis]|uniref:2'-5' RNA ligase family protein n=1 Tax=Acinetobacter sp. A7.4 TaxID=2919921 RepID=UPI001F4E52F3|nr:2'-5' RNA ligase family protein [Acinetobacter sp. A7.4]MCJ8160767.1 2'-5' RNA ligase family protein [Acinetobacter sp. A7.4]